MSPGIVKELEEGLAAGLSRWPSNVVIVCFLVVRGHDDVSSELYADLRYECGGKDRIREKAKK